VPRRALAIAALLAITVLPCGCHTVRYDTGRPASPRRVELTLHFYAWGLGGQPVTVDLDALCPEGAARWRSGSTAGDWFLSVITLGLYTPRTVVVECAEVAR
jgi:hypothetical protein